MADRPYAPLPVPPRTSSQNLNTVEPDQIEGIPTQASEVKKKALTEELGGTGTTIIGGYLVDQDYNPEFTGTKRIDLFDEMRLSDATVRAGLNMVKLPLLSADWYVKDPNGDAEPNEPTEFIRKQLFNNPHFSWTAFLRQALTMCDYGNAIFEKVFETLPDGKMGWKRFSPRKSKTIYKWTIKDGDKEVPGIYQILPTGKTAEIPRWKLLYLINEQEGSNYEGISLLRAAHKPWFYKNLYYKIDSLAAQKQGMGIPIIRVPLNASPQDKAKAKEIAKNIRVNEASYVELPDGFTLEFIETHADTLKDSKEMIDHHDRQISKAFLAQFLELGAQKSGSYALSEDQSKIFMLGLEYIAKIIQEEMNKAIRELVNLNFSGLDEDEYPILEYGAIGDVDYKTLSEALKTLSDGKLITPTVDIEKYLLATMKLPEAEDLAEQWEEKEAQAEAMLSLSTPAPQEDKKPNPQAKQPAKDEGSDSDEATKKASSLKTTEFMQDIMEFHEQLEAVIREKRLYVQ